MMSKKQTENLLQSLMQKSRPAGIYLILATARPSIDVITGTLKANIPTRVAFRLPSAVDSRMVLDTFGAENLLTKGDYLWSSFSATSPVRMQAPYVSDEEMESVIEFIKKKNKPAVNKKAVDFINETEEKKQQKEENELYRNALALILENKSVSISLLQRKLCVGYNRAGALVERMETDGFISSFDGSKAREVYITQETFDKLYPTKEE